MWILESTTPDHPLLFRLLPGTHKTLGRAQRADFIVDAALVSRIHCRVTLDPSNRLVIEDLGSTNGTYINGHRLQKASLVSGDRVKIGRVEFEVRSTAADAVNE